MSWSSTIGLGFVLAVVVSISACGDGAASDSAEDQETTGQSGALDDSETPEATSGGDPLSTAEAWIGFFEAGDVEGYHALMSPEATYACIECSYGALDHTGTYFGDESTGFRDAEGADSRRFAISDGSVDSTCAAEGSLVTCVSTYSSQFAYRDASGQPTDQYTATLEFTVDNGQIVDYVHTHQTGNLFDYGLIASYGTWLEDTYPQDHDELFYLGTMLLSNDAQLERHAELVSEWVETQ